MAKLTLESFKNFFKYYNGEEHQIKAIELLYEDLEHDCCEHLDESSEWVSQYRTPIATTFCRKGTRRAMAYH